MIFSNSSWLLGSNTILSNWFGRYFSTHGIDPFSVENYLLDVDNPVVVPRGAKVRLLFTSNDVIHAWWMPDFAIKKDAVPGIVNEAWFRPNEVGTYRGQCAELCGKDHGYMPIVVEVVEPEAFDAWIASRGEEL